MEKKQAIEEEARPSQSKSMHYELAKREMTDEELQKIRDMNWEWYYNCYLNLDEPIMVSCKICGAINIFLPREMKKKCGECGIECHRCEIDEDKK
jgi:hypothetical protein